MLRASSIFVGGQYAPVAQVGKGGGLVHVTQHAAEHLRLPLVANHLPEVGAGAVQGQHLVVAAEDDVQGRVDHKRLVVVHLGIRIVVGGAVGDSRPGGSVGTIFWIVGRRISHVEDLCAGRERQRKSMTEQSGGKLPASRTGAGLVSEPLGAVASPARGVPPEPLWVSLWLQRPAAQGQPVAAGSNDCDPIKTYRRIRSSSNSSTSSYSRCQV